MAQGLRQFAARPSWRPGARIFTGRGLRDAFGQRPCLTWAVTARGSAWGIVCRPMAGEVSGGSGRERQHSRRQGRKGASRGLHLWTRSMPNLVERYGTRH
jgi:hypothetical protein